MSMISLSVKDLNVKIGLDHILKDISFSFDGNESIGIVGESGSGKTMISRALLGLLPAGSRVSGEYRISGSEFPLNARERSWSAVRGNRIGLVMQDPFTALDLLGKCGPQITAGVPREKRRKFNIGAALHEVGLPADVADKYPFELSGGMRQRVVIAAALATEPELLIADEATTALDVITQDEILDLIETIHQKRGMPLILITHDMRLIYERTSRIIVVGSGQIIESGQTKEVIGNPKTAYTKALIEADRLLNSRGFPDSDSNPVLDTRPLLKVRGLSKRFGGKTALSDVSIQIGKGECVGIVGESGSGKTTLARCIVGLETPDSGSISYGGKGNPQIVFQDPFSSLNPAHKVRYILEESLMVSGRRKDELPELCRLAEVPEEVLDRRPAGLSGGQRQRIAIARALAPSPDLLICDESVSALDAVVQNSILAMLEKLRKEKGLSILFITHDLSVVRMLTKRIYVMKNAQITESGTTEEIFTTPRDEYTKKLLKAAGLHR